MLKTVLVLGVAVTDRVGAFNVPNLANIFKPTPAAGKPATYEPRLLQAISNTGNGKDADLDTQKGVLALVRQMETSAAPRPTLLSDPKEAQILDGDWFLQYTAPSEIDGVDADDRWVAVAGSEGKDNIDTRRFQGGGAISGGGIPVDASSNVALQSFDIQRSRVTNEIQTGIGLVTVGGTYSQSEAVPLRALVAFDTAKIALNVGVTLDISFLFDIRSAIKGSKNSGWVETTYISRDVRVGRGNKGSLFILTRDREAVQA